MITFDSVQDKIDSFITFTKLNELLFYKTTKQLGDFDCHTYSFINQSNKFKFELLIKENIVHRIEVFRIEDGRIPEDTYKILSFPNNQEFDKFLNSLLV